tara:strand:- start:1532 stop:1765 length:234 start_codon:yes stop_codon:yes gene_type:complete
MDYLLNPDFLFTLNDFNQKDVDYVINTFKFQELKKRNKYLYQNYVNIKDKQKWFNSKKQHKEYANNNNQIKIIQKLL